MSYRRFRPPADTPSTPCAQYGARLRPQITDCEAIVIIVVLGFAGWLVSRGTSPRDSLLLAVSVPLLVLWAGPRTTASLSAITAPRGRRR